MDPIILSAASLYLDAPLVAPVLSQIFHPGHMGWGLWIRKEGIYVFILFILPKLA